MATKPIGAGTCNFPVNMPVEERLVWGSLAVRRNKSAGELARQAMLIGLRVLDASAAKSVEAIRASRKPMIHACLFITLGISIAQSLAASYSGGDHQDMRGNRTPARSAKSMAKTAKRGKEIEV